MRGDKYSGKYDPTKPTGKFQEGEVVEIIYHNNPTYRRQLGIIVGHKTYKGAAGYFVLLRDAKNNLKVVGCASQYMKSQGTIAPKDEWESYAPPKEAIPLAPPNRILKVDNPKMEKWMAETAERFGFEFHPVTMEVAERTEGRRSYKNVLIADKLFAKLAHVPQSQMVVGRAHISKSKRGNKTSYIVQYTFDYDLVEPPNQFYSFRSSTADVVQARMAVEDLNDIYQKYLHVKELVDDDDADIIGI